MVNKFFNENITVNEITWKNILAPDRPRMTIGRMPFAFWVPNAVIIL
jgi:hypothetical protein